METYLLIIIILLVVFGVGRWLDILRNGDPHWNDAETLFDAAMRHYRAMAMYYEKEGDLGREAEARARGNEAAAMACVCKARKKLGR